MYAIRSYYANMRAYLFWAVRDWLNPANSKGACLPFDSELMEEATEIRWKFRSDGKIIIEPKEDIKKRLKRSTDKFDALARITSYNVCYTKLLRIRTCRSISRYTCQNHIIRRYIDRKISLILPAFFPNWLVCLL